MNGHMGISCFERNGSFACIYGSECYSSRVILSSWRPVHLYVKSGKKIRTCGLRIKALEKEENGSSNRLVFEKEFEFKPSFVEYLKAMESVKTGREKKQGNSRESDTDTPPSLGMDRRGKNSRSYKGFEETKLIENDESVENGDGVVGDEHKYRKKGMQEFNGRLTSQERSVLASRRHKQGGAIRSAWWPNNQTRNKNSELQHLNLGKETRKARDILVESNDNQCLRSTDRVKTKFARDKNSSELLDGNRMIIKEDDIAKGGNKLIDRLVSNYIQDNEKFDKEMIQRKVLVKESNHIGLEKGDDGALEMERAAFKHLHEAHDVIGKLRVPRAEMEERIQMLAQCLNGADIDMPEWLFSKMIRSAKIKYTDHSILRIIQILGKLGNWRRVLQVIEWLQMRERFKSHNLRYCALPLFFALICMLPGGTSLY
uniref:Pentatricopeptide repeat-containing protein At1g30610ic n=1 Tax=Rhizophora mucronata TaxID=61149 RepID=A0A2P2JXG2_RHIMU